MYVMIFKMLLSNAKHILIILTNTVNQMTEQSFEAQCYFDDLISKSMHCTDIPSG